jgi:hypothetical protein
MISPISPVSENYQKISIDDYVRQARISLKKAIVEAQIDVNGMDIILCKSHTRFGGERLWFKCPKCNKRRGVLYMFSLGIKTMCRQCFTDKRIMV